jgi:hypothetical protein
MVAPRVYADFHNLDDRNRLLLTCVGTRDDLVRQGVELKEGLTLTFYMDDADDEGRPDEILTQGTVHFDEQSRSWVAAVDWSNVWHASDQVANGTAPPGTSGRNK